MKASEAKTRLKDAHDEIVEQHKVKVFPILALTEELKQVPDETVLDRSLVRRVNLLTRKVNT